MRAVVQRVDDAFVEVDGRPAEAGARIGVGLLVYLGVAADDEPADVEYLAVKVRHLRVFAGGGKHMNRDVIEVDGQVLVVSAFTVQADARRGRRPSLDDVAGPEHALDLYQRFCSKLESLGVPVARGAFGCEMKVHATNAGPVCILLDSNKTF